MSFKPMKTKQVACQHCVSCRSSIFSKCGVNTLDIITQNKSCNTYRKGQILFFEGNNPMGLHCILEGTVKVYKTGFDGKEQIMRIAKNGDALGYRALIAEESYIHSAATLEDTTICFIPTDTFHLVLKEDPSLSKVLMKSLCKDLNISSQTIVNMAQKNVRERVAETLLHLQKSFQRPEDTEAELIRIPILREDLANLVGTATESLIRFLTEFKEAGWIAMEGKRIRILNRKALIQQARI